jgi:putative ABC transport system permease protein
MENLIREFRYGVRNLRKRPLFALTIILIFALALAGNAAIFSLVYTILIQPPPYEEPDRLVRLWEVDQASPRDFQMTSGSNFMDWRNRNRTLEGIAAWSRPGFQTLTAQTPAEEIRTVSVTSNFFNVFKVNAAIGRTFLPEEDQIETGAVVVSHGFWQSRMGGRRDVLNAKVELDEEGYNIVGVMPADFKALMGRVDIWLPMHLEGSAIDRGQNYLQAVARLKPEITIQQAQSDLAAVAATLEKQYPDSNLRQGIAVVALETQLNSALRTPLLILFCAVALVMMIGCFNIANLLALRGMDRRKEFSLRLALGATRGQIIRHVLIENMILFLLGGTTGLIFSGWLLRGLLFLDLQLLPEVYVIKSMGIETFLFCFGWIAITGLLFGGLPAFQFRMRTTTLQSNERSGTDDRFSNMLRNSFVIGQIALSLALSIPAGLLLQSFLSIRNTPTGFQGDQVVVAYQSVDGARYVEPDARSAYYKKLIQRFRNLPGVKNAAASTVIPLGDFGIDFQVPVTREENTVQPLALLPQAYFRAVTPEYFRTLQVPLLRGRYFTDHDDPSATLVVILNEALAKRMWPGGDAVGKKLRLFWADWRTYEVVGIVQNTLSYGAIAGPVPEVYVSDSQIPYSIMNVLIRFDTASSASTEIVRKAFLEVDPHQPVQEITTMNALIDRSTNRERLVAILVGVFGIFAILLASAGIYGTISFTIASKTREIGVRMALGATRPQIRNWILSRSANLVAPGILLGIFCALAGVSFLQKFLYGIEATDLLTFLASTALLCLTALLACIVPAKRASRMDPNAALRYE